MGVTISAEINLKILDFNLSVNHAFVESPDSNSRPSQTQRFPSYVSLNLVVVIRISF